MSSNKGSAARVFFSYSRQQSEIVHSVARELGRPFAAIDTYEFKAADDLVAAMEAAVADASVFAFFASKESMSSAWVNFESREARYHTALGRIKKVIVVVLDDRIRETDFPEWMLRYKFVRSKSPKPIARAIRGLVDELVEAQQSRFFVGRGKEAAALQAALVHPESAMPASLVTLTGLPGIGRKTLLTRVVRDSIGIDRIIKIDVEDGDSIQDLTTKLADLVEVVANPSDSLKVVKEIQALNEGSAVQRFARYAKDVATAREMVVLYDSGGLIDGAGAVRRVVRDILLELGKDSSVLVAIVSNRRPLWRLTPELEGNAIVRVEPLPTLDMRQLIALQARARGITLTSYQLNLMAEQARGYPPAANILTQMAEAYGAELASRPMGRTSTYSPRPLGRYLRTLTHDSVERSILQVLSGNSPLPIQLIEQVLKGPVEAIRAGIVKLIDTSLVIPDGTTGWYRIADPVVEFVEREYHGCTREQYQDVAEALKSFLENDEEERSYFELERVRFRALLTSGQRHGGTEAMSLFADWVRLAASFYHRRNYERSLEIAQAALESRPSEPGPLYWAIRSQVRLGDFDGALSGLEGLVKLGRGRDANFLRGFLERHRGRHKEATRFYERALTDGYGGLAIHRDLAECYLHLERLDKALYHVEIARSLQAENRFIIDLQIKILCREKKEVEARDLLAQLEAVDDQSFAAHRRSRVAYEFGNYDEAYQAARRAATSAERPAFEVLANLALCEVITNRLEDAQQTLDQLRQLYRAQRKDVQTGIRVQLLIAQRDYESALVACSSFEDSERPQHLWLQFQAIEGILKHAPLNSAKRSEYETRVRNLGQLLTKRFGRLDWDIDPE
ncbi:toll/interleukin-1 receptor domain-containing protein [Micromonospora sp. WMMC250]|uniref:toll/interleukin-1 receptor domain-containing protein n=1 Tax=Micromonospora sp. WMMC250 TaxID=3014781 RepID=UPI0022B60817|nr:toll/interleukin-1 receptor domain-containing protein [Micromonospora sp. WMMC250]MCZ7374044.1 TIR domain-containing protein [Micromonospora sp. WMMC250]